MVGGASGGVGMSAYRVDFSSSGINVRFVAFSTYIPDLLWSGIVILAYLYVGGEVDNRVWVGTHAFLLIENASYSFPRVEPSLPTYQMSSGLI